MNRIALSDIWEDAFFLSTHVLPVCVAAGRGWRCQPEQQPWRPAQLRLHVQHRTQSPSGGFQRLKTLDSTDLHIWHALMCEWCFTTTIFFPLTAGLFAGLPGQVPTTLELKVEKQDKDDMHDSLSTDTRSDDESDKRDMKTPRAGPRTR